MNPIHQPVRLLLAIAVAGALSFPASASGELPSGRADGASHSLASRDAGSPSVSEGSGEPGVSAGVIAKEKGNGKAVRPKLLKTPKGKTDKSYAAELKATGRYEYATPNYVRRALAYTATPNDPDFNNPEQWNIGPVDTETNLPTYIPYSKSWWNQLGSSPRFNEVAPYLDGSTSPTVPYRAQADPARIPVAVIDTGLYLDHPDVSANIVGKWDFFETYSSTTDVFTDDDDVTPAPASAPYNDEFSAAHGTMCASEIAQGTDNGIGGAAAAPGAVVWVYKVQGIWLEGLPEMGYPAGSAVMFDWPIIESIYSAVDSGAKVISMSLGGSDYSQPFQDAIDYAYTRGVVVVAATGNDGLSSISYPAGMNHVLGIGATQAANPDSIVRVHFSNFGIGTDLMAPGTHVWGPIRPGYDYDGVYTAYQPGYAWWSGTSMATPLTAAAAANLLRFVPALTPDELEYFLASTARDMTDATDFQTPGYDTMTGWGQVDMVAAYNKLKVTYPALGRPVLTGVTPGERRNTVPTISWAAVPYATAYRVAVDSGAPNLRTDRTLSAMVLEDGAHTVSVQSFSPKNWNGEFSKTTVSFTLDTVPPAAPVPSYDARVVSWQAIAETGHHYEYALNSTEPASVQTTAETSFSVGDLPDGDHRAYVRCVDAAGNRSDWGIVAFTILTPPHDVPDLQPRYETQSDSLGVSWTPIDRAHWYDVEFGGSIMASATTNSIALTAIKPHDNKLRVRAANRSGVGPWASAVVSYEKPKPAAVTVEASSVVTFPDVVLSWQPVEWAEWYELKANEGEPTSATSPSTVSGLVRGENTVEVRAANFSQSGDWAPVIVRYIPIPSGTPVIEDQETSSLSIEVSWTAVADADRYQVELNGSLVETTTSASMTLDLRPGANQVRVRAASETGVAPEWGTAVILRLPAAMKRVSGTNRYSGSAEVARDAFDTSTASGTQWADIRHIVLASGDDRAAADPLAAAGLCGVYDAPMFLVSATAVDPTVLQAIKEIASQAGGPVTMHVVGGRVSVPEARLADITRVSGGKIVPLRVQESGDRFSLAVAIAEEMRRVTGKAPEKVLVANGADSTKFFDALALSPIAAQKAYPILLVNADSVPAATQAFIQKYRPAAIVGGGSKTVSDSVVRSLGGVRWAGSTRYSTALVIADKAVSQLGTSTSAIAVAAKLPDALTGGAAAGKKRGLLVLTDGASLTPETAQWLSAHKTDISSCTLYGGDRSLTTAVASGIASKLAY